VAYLFDTDAVSELFKPRPNARYVAWLQGVTRAEQFTSSVVVGELFAGALRARARAVHLRNIKERVLPALTVLAYDLEAAEIYGRIRAELEDRGKPVADGDLQIAATAISHGLVVVTGNIHHFERIRGILLDPILSESRGV
jgi:predicted nucleic acid-binding protein